METGKWDDKLFGCGCYVRQRLEGIHWDTRYRVCATHQADESFMFLFNGVTDPHKARLIMLKQRYEYDRTSTRVD